jgi:hypothetical protein
VLLTYFHHLRTAWRPAPLRREALVTLFPAVLIIGGLTRFLDHVEHRAGVVLPDPVLALFPPIDLTWITFSVIYAGLIVAILLLLRAPERFLLALQSYLLVACVRMAAMALLPLDPPPGMIALKDPFVEFFGNGATLTRDLFFSGHTSTLLLVALTVPGRTARTALFACTAVVGTCVLLQHVHYTIDVLAAPFFAYGCYRVVGLVRTHAGHAHKAGGGE